MPMDYVTVRELRAESAKVWDRIEAGEELVVTRNGKPIALLLHTAPAEVEQALRAYRAARLGTVLDRIQTLASVQGLDQLGAEAIDAEVAAVRAQRRSTAQRAARSARPDTKPAATRRAQPGRR
jgi:prevent-host-death family protein